MKVDNRVRAANEIADILRKYDDGTQDSIDVLIEVLAATVIVQSECRAQARSAAQAILKRC